MRLLPRSSLALPFALIPTLALAGPPDEIDEPPDTPVIWGGEDTEPCAWPSVVMVTGGGSLCSAALIHPKVVLYAAHCGYQDKSVRFGDSQNSGKTRQVEYCKVNPSYNGNSQSNDWAYCVLQEEVTEIPFTPVGYGCEVNQYAHNGADIAIVGFGNDTGDTGAGRKRWAFTKMFNMDATTFDVGGNGYPTICSGDSGGPAFIRYDDGSWHSYGIASTKYDDTCTQAPGTHSRSHNAAKWIENDSGIDVTVCHDNDGNWDPGYLCGGFFNGEPALTYGSWYTWCEDATRSDWSSTCGTDYGVNAETVPPDLQITTPSDGQSFVGEPTIVDIEIAVNDASGFWDVYLDITPMVGDPVSTPVVSNENPTVIAGAEFYSGEYTLVAHATDFWGNQAVSAPVTFSVVEDQTDTGPSDTGDTSSSTDTGVEGESTGDPSDSGGLDEVGDTSGDPGVSDDAGDCSCQSDRSSGGGAWLMIAGLGLLGLRRRTR
ncbi:S1 family peptidase [Nannocystaceae bacterium ST9]